MYIVYADGRDGVTCEYVTNNLADAYIKMKELDNGFFVKDSTRKEIKK